MISLKAVMGRLRPESVSEELEFQLSTSHRCDAVILKFDGELDLTNRDEVADAILEAECCDATWIVLDLQDLAFIDLASIKVLTEASRRSAADGGRLRITHARPAIRRVFRQAGAEEELPIIAGEGPVIQPFPVIVPETAGLAPGFVSPLQPAAPVSEMRAGVSASQRQGLINRWERT